MLQIYLYGEQEQGFIDLQPNTQLQLEETAELFDEDLSSGTFSLPLNIPMTDKNRRIFGFTDSVENFKKQLAYWRCDVFDSGFAEMVNAKITLLEKEGFFSRKKGFINTTISGSKGLYGSLIKGKYLTDLALGGIIDWSSLNYDSRTYATALMKKEMPDIPYMAFAPVAFENYFDQQRADFSGEFLVKDTVNFVVVTNAGTGSWKFGRPTVADTTVAAVPGTDEYEDYRTIPFLKVKYVLQKCFQEFGYTITGNFLDLPDFDNLFLLNNYSIEVYTAHTFFDTNRRINPSNHVPKVLIKDWLIALFGFFNIYPKFYGINKVQLSYRREIYADRNVLPVSSLVADKFNSSFATGDSTEVGYTISQNWDSADGAFSDRVKDLSSKTLIATVYSYGQLSSVDIGRALTTSDMVLVLADNMYYTVADGTSTPVKWDAFSDALHPYIVDKGERTIGLDISTLCNYVTFNEDQALYINERYCGCKLPGTYTNKKGTLVNYDMGLHVFYINKKNAAELVQPTSYVHNRDADNNIIEKYSLALKGNEGIALSFHSLWQDTKQKAEILQTQIKANQKIINDLAACSMVEINNVLLLPYKIEKTIPLNGAVKIHLMPL